MKVLLSVLCLLFLTACDPQMNDKYVDQCKRTEIFTKCVVTISEHGTTKNENLHEAILACDLSAYKQSLRPTYTQDNKSCITSSKMGVY